MADRYFTLEEANAALTVVRPIAERLVELRTRLRDALARRETLQSTIGGNGGGLTASDLVELDAEVEQLGNAVGTCVARIHAAGAQVKDLDTGLLDFPGLREGREILYCWRVGEAEIGFWHGLDEGFAGRKPIDVVE